MQSLGLLLVRRDMPAATPRTREEDGCLHLPLLRLAALQVQLGCGGGHTGVRKDDQERM